MRALKQCKSNGWLRSCPLPTSPSATCSKGYRRAPTSIEHLAFLVWVQDVWSGWPDTVDSWNISPSPLVFKGLGSSNLYNVPCCLWRHGDKYILFKSRYFSNHNLQMLKVFHVGKTNESHRDWFCSQGVQEATAGEHYWKPGYTYGFNELVIKYNSTHMQFLPCFVVRSPPPLAIPHISSKVEIISSLVY